MDEKDPYDLNDFSEYGNSHSRPSDYPVPQPSGQAVPPSQPTPSGAPSFVSVPCSACGYNLTGVAIGGTCPECGALVDDSLYASSAAPPNGFAITSMVIGIVSVCGLCCCWGGFLGILGLIFGFIANNQMKSGKYSSSSRGMALAGLICSGVALAITSVFLLLAVIDAF